MDSDPLDQLQSMFPTIEGDVIAIVFSESDKDVSSTVEKLLQLVPNESEQEFPSLASTVQRSQLPVQSYRVQSSNFQPGRSASGLVSVSSPGLVDQPISKLSSNASWQNQQRVNRRLQGPTHVPPAMKKRQHGQTNFGKGTAPGNQKRAGGYSEDVSLNGQTTHPQQQQPQQQVQGKFYQIGGSSAVNSMPALSTLESSYLYHQALQTQRNLHVQQQQQQLHHQYQPQPQSQSHSQFQSQYRGQQLGHGTAYSGVKPNDPFLANWFNSPGQIDLANALKGPLIGQQPPGHQNWPNVGADGRIGSLQQYQHQQEHIIKTQNPNPLPYGRSSEGFPLHALWGNPSDQNHGPGWPMYSAGGSSSGGSEERGRMDTVSALIQPERSPSSGLLRYGHIESEPSLAKLSTNGHHGRNVGAAPGNKVDTHGKKAGGHAASRVGRATSGMTNNRKSESSGVKNNVGSRKLIILRGLPGSGKTTLARSLVGSNGVICCTDDFFVKNGEYVFDPSLLEENHHRNKCKAGDAMKNGHSPVIIDNTNTNAWEMKPYVLLAMEHGYAVEILEPDTPWRFKTAELARRNSHSVPRSTLEKMLERYDHRVTLESIIVSQQPERKPPVQAPVDSEPSRSGSGGQSTNTGGHKGGRTTKVSPTTPRQQQGGGASNADHTHSSAQHQKQQTRSGQLSPRPRKGGQRSNDNGGRVSPRPGYQRGQRSSKDSGTSAASSRNGNEGRPGGDARKKTTPIGSNQHQGAHHSNTAQNDQFSRGKGKRTTTLQQQAGNRSTQNTTTVSNKKRSVSPSSRAKTSSKQNSQTVGGKENGHHRHPNDKGMRSEHLQNSSSENGKRSIKGTGEDADDEFLWDSSEELEILEASSSDDGDALDHVGGRGPVFMTDDPPKDAFFRPVPHVGRPLTNGGVGAVDGGSSVEGGDGGNGIPVFEVWKDSDDEDIDDIDEGQGEGLEETALPVIQTGSGQEGQSQPQQQILQRTAEVVNIGELLYSTHVDVVNIPPSQPWERTQSARNLQNVTDQYNSLIRRVQSADPTRGLSVLSEAEGVQAVADVCDDTFNVFTMSSVWASQSGLLSSKMELFDDDSNSKSRVDRIDSTIKSVSSLQSTDSNDSQLEKQKKAQSFYSMLDALTEEMSTAAVDRVLNDENESIARAEEEGVDSFVRKTTTRKWKLLEEAVQSTQGSSTIEEAAKDEAKCPLRSILIEGLMMESASMSDENRCARQTVIKEANDVLNTKVDVVTFVPKYLSVSDLDDGDFPPPAKVDPSFVDGDNPLDGGVVSILADFNFEPGCSLEALTDKIFVEEHLCDEQSFPSLQIAFQKVVQRAVLEQQFSLFTVVSDVGAESEGAEKPDEYIDSTFEDPAVLAKVCLERRESDTKQQPAPKVTKSLGVTLQELSVDESESKQVRERDASKSFPMSSPGQFEPLDVFPSAFDEGGGTRFPLGVISTEAAARSQSTSREQTASLSEPNSSPLFSQTPINDSTEPEISSADTGDGIDDGCGLEEQETFEPTSTEAGKPTNEEVASAEDSALTLTTSEPSLEGYYLNLGTTSSADNLPSSNLESDLLFLVECFPDLEPNYLSMILKMSKGSVEGAISMIVVSHSSLAGGPTDPNFMYFDSHVCTETTDDASSTLSSASYTELYPSKFCGQLVDSSPEQRTASSHSRVDHMHAQEEGQRAIFSIGGGEGDAEGDVQERAFVPFFDEPQCASDEQIARALQEELDHEAASDEKLDRDAGTSAGDQLKTLGQSSSRGSEVGREACPTEGENLELKLSASLARQLQDMFGPVSDKLPFDSEIGEEDLVVLLSERAAREIYKKWLDTLHAKRIGYKVQSEIELTRDEALARRLQEEEDSRAAAAAGEPGSEGGKKLRRKGRHKFRHLTEPAPLAVMAADNYRVHHNSSPPQLGVLESSPQTGGGLVDIMGEQMAQQMQEAEVAQVVKEEVGPNLSLKLQLKTLYFQFPSLEQPLVNETLVKNKFDLNATVSELKQIVLAPPPPPSSSSFIQRESVDGRGLPRFNKPYKSGAGSPAKRRLFKGEGKEPAADERVGDYRALDEDERQALYIELRAEAALHAKLRAESFMKAAHARGKKQYDVAQYYAQQGHLHTEKMKEANQRAAEATLKQNFTSSDELDLHGLHVDEAIIALEEKLNWCKGSKLRVVTGQGIHSKGGKGARIRPAVVNYLQNKRYKFMFEERNPGVLTVKLK